MIIIISDVHSTTIISSSDPTIITNNETQSTSVQGKYININEY